MSKFGFRITGRPGAVLQSRLGPAAAILITFAAVAGCEQAQSSGAADGKARAETSALSTTTASASPAVSLPVMTRVQTGALASVTTGHLAFSDGCYYLTSPGSTKQVGLVWPHGFTAVAGSAGIYNGAGTLVAKPGDDIVLGGGPEILAHVPSGTITNTQCLAGTTTAWFVASVGQK
jgi:hypothetical protein